MAKLSALPELTPGGGGGVWIKPPYAQAPEETPRPDVPKGRVVHLTLPRGGQLLYPGTGMLGALVNRAVTVYIPSQYVPGTPAPLLARRTRWAPAATSCPRSSTT